MKKERLQIISKEEILKGELPDFEWHFIDLTQFKKRLEWLNEELLKYANDELGGEIIEMPQLIKCSDLIHEAFKELS